PLERQPVDLVDVVVGAVDAAQAVGEEHPVHLRIDDAATVIGDELRLRQVIDNLLANVRTHTPVGTSCTLELANGDGNVTITLSDDGLGMNPADAARAFDRFHRADSSRTRASGGTGLGLAIVAAIVNAHHGDVTMQSDIGRGTTVTVRLPQAPDSDE